MAFRHLSLLILLSASARGKTRFYDNTKWAGDSLAGGSCMTSKGACMFPFEYKGKKINGCIPKKGWAWCATKKDRVGDWWAVCPKECKLHVGRATDVPCTGRYEYDVEYSQYDIRSCGENKKPTASACQEFCQSVPGCVGWEWGYAGDNCCAKSHMSNRKSGIPGRVAGRVNACPPGCDGKDNALTNLASIAVMKSNGFKFDFTVPNADNNGVGQHCVANGEKAKWFGWSSGNAAGTLSATFTGYGEVTVDFGNCWTAGNVKLYLDSKLISTAPFGTKSQKATFAYTPGSVLKLKDENGNAVVMLNSISVNCNGNSCTDKDTRCPGWKDYCKNELYQYSMKEKCPKTCRLCEGTLWFYITSELNSQAITIRGNGVVMWRKTGAANQLWRWGWAGNTLVSKLNGMLLTIRDGNRGKKATVCMLTRYHRNKGQEWRLEDGRLVSGLNGLVLNVKNGDKKRGNTVWMWEKNESKAQKWKLQLAAAVKTVNHCTGEPGCCTEKYKCAEGEGGCDNHDQCRGDLNMCGNDNCPWPGWHWDGANCCTEGSYKCGEGNKICRECTSDSPCARGFGDCEWDSECAGDLKCGSGNCPWDQNKPWYVDQDDCCV